MYTLPDLKYSYDALEPYIDTETMKIHHTKHHQNYTNNLNEALAKFSELREHTLAELLTNTVIIPKSIRTAVINNGGGHYNHSLFWQMMSPNKPQPNSVMAKTINDTFNSMGEFQEQFSKEALSNFGSGWTWLVLDKDKNLKISSTSNQDSPLSVGCIPLLGLDLWEHAYYLKYQNRRADYIKNWWNIVNWEFVAEELERGLLN